MKKSRIWLIILLSVFAAAMMAFAVLNGIYKYRSDFKVTFIAESVSPDGEYSVVLDQVGEPDFPFGPVKARISLKAGDKTIRTVDTEVWDDGANLGAQSWNVEWREDGASVTLLGSEQEPETVFLAKK